jgi:DNA-binding NtrC family response regulator
MDKLSGRILVVDDDPEMCQLLADVLSAEGHSVMTVTTGEEALVLLSDELDLLITDLNLKEMKGLELMHRVKQQKPEISVVMITAFGTIESAIEAMKMGAYDYISKPFKTDELTIVVHKALQEGALRREVVRLRKAVGQEYQFGNIIGKSKPMQVIFDLIQRVSNTSSNVLITGESGTGKELVAKAIHYNSLRKDRPFIPVNCAAIPETLLESELFGHVRGAFTDAKGDKAGLFEEAAGGTLFLDEISELPLNLQAKLLRVLQDKEVRRIGAGKSIKVDARVIAASNLDLSDEVKQRKFRQDLFYRLNVLQIQVPPLRDRKDDILSLAHHFLKKFQQEVSKPIKGFNESVLALFLDYSWPGNVRELENAIERAVILAQGDQITLKDLPSTLTSSREDYSTLEKALERQLSLEELEQEYIARILEQTGGNKYKAAQILGIDRKTLYRKIGQFKSKNTLHIPEETSA